MIGWAIVNLIRLHQERDRLRPEDPIFHQRLHELDGRIELAAAEIDQALQQLVHR